MIQPTPRLAARRLTLGYGREPVIPSIDLDLPDGTVTAIVGPNGCGKSTLLRGLGRLLPAREGAVLLDGVPIDRVPTRQIARTVSILPQSPLAPEGLLVADLVARGRQPHHTWLRQWALGDDEAVTEALERTSIADLARRPLDELSGGQRQRAWIAMTLAQQTDILLLDEPTTFLDLAHAISVLDLVASLRHELGRTVVMVLHDLNLAARYAEHLVVMQEGRIVAQGAPRDVLSSAVLLEAFGLRAEVVPDPVRGGVLVVPC